MSGDLSPESLSRYRSAPAYAVTVFWTCAALFSLAWFVDNPWSYLLLLFILPVFYGTHEVVHDTLLPRLGPLSRGRKLHNEIAGLVGFALQGMNYQASRPSHFTHHTYGRFDEGYAPDITIERITVWNRVEYFLTLLGVPTLANQVGCLALLFAPSQRAGYVFDLKLSRSRHLFPYWLVQIVVIASVAGMIYFGGWTKFLIFETFFCIAWSALQNVSHYGLKGVDPFTDRVCARTYILPLWARVLTYGSTSHLAHHVFMDIPGAYLHETVVLNEVERRVGAQIQIKHGLIPFIGDVLRQFRGPLREEQLSTNWMLTSTPQDTVMYTSSGFGHRRGRKWAKSK